jgi:hypothetical protein
MPALDGQSISTITDGDGKTVIAVVIFWNPADGTLRNANYTTVQDGVKNGAVIADNVTNNPISIVLKNDVNGNARKISIPAHGRALTVAQLAAINPPVGPITTHADVQGFSFDFSG